MSEQICLADFAPQGAVYDGLVRTLSSGTFVHAYLISGMPGVGKRTLAELMTRYLLCTGEDKPCGMCPSCVQAADGNHPEVITLRPGMMVNGTPTKSPNTIRVDEIREVTRICGEHTYRGGRRIVRIEQADKMNANAQNALLKTLEEPIEGTIFLLITDSPGQFLPTIVSRCRQLKLHAWPDEVVMRVLATSGVPQARQRQALHVAGGSIGRAKAIVSDEGYWQRRDEVMHDFFALENRSSILSVSEKWKDRKTEAEALLDDIEDMTHTLMLVRLGQLPRDAAGDYPASWQQMAQKAGPDAFVRLLAAMSEARRLRMNQVTWQAVAERLLLSLMEERNRWST